MNRVDHVMISASAGSGKTYQLTTRYVALLARGQSPDRIVALTFTKKAAGEFFNEILYKLAQASEFPEKASHLAIAIGKAEMRCEHFTRLLKIVIDSMPRLRLGTMDGFFAAIVKAFPLELGLSGDFELLQDHAARLERRRVLEQLYMSSLNGLKEAQKDFIENFKRATFGTEEKRLGQQLDRFIDQYHQIYLDVPEAKFWGNAKAIWPHETYILNCDGNFEQALSVLKLWVNSKSETQNSRERWNQFFEAFRVWKPGSPLSNQLTYVLKKAIEQWEVFCAGQVELKFERSIQSLDVDATQALYTLIKYIITQEFLKKLEVTQGIFAVLKSYDETYQSSVRSKGNLTFSDVQRILEPKLLSNEFESADRLQVDYRLDGRIDHWLLDEFQDTSFGQWKILKNLIDEVVQDPEGNRSFFCVGDIKQAIFSWRKGDPRLFNQVLEFYNTSSPGLIKEEHLVESRRSAPAVIEMVNNVFGATAVMKKLFPLDAATSWQKAWSTHTAFNRDVPGYATLLFAANEQDRWNVCLKLLQEIKPIERGLTVAILVQQNDHATELADYLRHQGKIPAVAESDLNICIDNPLGVALLAMIKVAAHPGDSLAWGHLQMTPFLAVFEAKQLVNPFLLSQNLLNQIYSLGFERTLEYWVDLIEPFLVGGDSFSRLRGRQIIAAAGLFDQTKSRNLDEFSDFMQRHVVRDAEADAVVRIMTIHKAKGLGFDLVILPELEGDALAQRRDGMAVHETDDRHVAWVLDIPSKIIYECDKVVSAHVEFEKAEACYEKLSLLYVAMTRAKLATYVIIEKPKEKSTSANFKQLLCNALGSNEVELSIGALVVRGSWSCGEPLWYQCYKGKLAIDSALLHTPTVEVSRVQASNRHESQRPSIDKNISIPISSLFEVQSGLEHGTLVHHLLAQVEWVQTDEVKKYTKDWAHLGNVAREAIACLKAPELYDVWTCPVGLPCEVWREKAFEVLLDSKWVSGVFDRVIVIREPSGRAIRATIYDFKTDKLPNNAKIKAETAGYTSQMVLYKKVVSILLNIDEEYVKTSVVFTKSYLSGLNT